VSAGFEVSETVQRPIGVVWARLTDLPGATRWLPGVEQLELVDDEFESLDDDTPLEVGTRYRFQARGGSHLGRVTALEPGTLLALTVHHGGVTATYEYRLADLGEATRITLHAWCQAPGMWRLFHPILDFLMRKSDGGQLADFRRMVDGD
jgi:carbon monoxide dehydrogenase subunit G